MTVTRLNDEEFMQAFESCTLPNTEFHHADHVRMAFLYLCRFSPLEALQRFSKSLANFATVNGKPKLYHETITWAFLFLIRERVARYSERTGTQPSWDEFARANSDLLSWKDSVLKRYYSDEMLSSELARKTFVFPDRL
jgi:hypothetical protein